MTEFDKEQMLCVAWVTRDYAIAKKTKVGAVARTETGVLYPGCNIEHDYCKSFHAEEVALMLAVSRGNKKIQAIAIVAEMERFTPCGGCLDWIAQFMDWNGYVLFQSKPHGPVQEYRLEDLYPVAPIKTKEPEKPMLTNLVELHDNSPMPFGSHVKTPMQDVPAQYLHYLWTNGLKAKAELEPTTNDILVARYIKANIRALKKEHKDGIWE